MTPFFTLFTLSHASDNTRPISQNIGGGGCMGRPPTSNFGGTVPQFPLGLRPCVYVSHEVLPARVVQGKINLAGILHLWPLFLNCCMYKSTIKLL